MATLASALITGMVSVATQHTAAAAPADNAAVVSGAARVTPDVARTMKGTGAAAAQNALKAYWSADRMKAARPDSELPAVKSAAARAVASVRPNTPTVPKGPAQRVPGVAPRTAPKAETTGAVPQAYDPGYPVGHPTARTNGKVFFTSFGVNYVCSGAIVNSEGGSTVWTAGHCVTDGQAWNYNWVFVPNYYSGVAPYGYWYAAQLWTTTAWFNNNNDFANDVGSAIMSRTNGYRIVDYLGGQGIAWNYGTGYFVYAFGYPQGSPFNGCCLYAEQNYMYDNGDGTIYMLNYMTGGSSGGPWLNWFDGNWGYINGHNDFKYNAYPQYMFSPYYGDQVANLYNTVRNLST